MQRRCLLYRGKLLGKPVAEDLDDDISFHTAWCVTNSIPSPPYDQSRLLSFPAGAVESTKAPSAFNLRLLFVHCQGRD